MKHIVSVLTLIGCSLVSSNLVGQAQTPGTMLGISLDLSGTLTVSSESPGGCPTRICTTNFETFSHCYTNCYWRLVCTTNATTGQVQCTNALVCSVHCYTNPFPEISCTNEFLAPTSVKVSEALSGTLTAGFDCDEVDGLFRTNAVFQAVLYATLRTNDWRGTHLGSFKVLNGTNVLASGALTGVNGVGSHRGLEFCAICNHIEGTLRGLVVESGPLRGARIQASYAGTLTGVSCPSAEVPQGVVSLAIDGVVVTPCPLLFGF